MGSRLEFAGSAVKSSDAENGSLGHDISNRKALIRYRGSEKEYQPRRGCLEVMERDFYSSRRDLVGPAHQYRFHQISRQSIISDSPCLKHLPAQIQLWGGSFLLISEFVMAPRAYWAGRLPAHS